MHFTAADFILFSISLVSLGQIISVWWRRADFPLYNFLVRKYRSPRSEEDFPFYSHLKSEPTNEKSDKLSLQYYIVSSDRITE